MVLFTLMVSTEVNGMPKMVSTWQSVSMQVLYKKKKQQLSENDINEVFDLCEDRPSNRTINIKTGVPYTTVCERLSGRTAGASEARGSTKY